MSGVNHKLVNNTFLQLASGIGTGDTTLSFTTGQGTRLPVVASPDFMYADLVRISTGELERVKITAHSSGADSCTVERGVDDTSPLTFIAADQLEVRIGAADLDQFPRLGLAENVVTAAGTADAITATLTRTGLQGGAIPDNFMIGIAGLSANQSNAPTLNLTLGTATGVKTIVKGNQLTLAGGDIPPLAWFMYRQTWDQWVLMNPFYGSMLAGDYVDSGNPATSRTGFLKPDGSLVSRTTYAALLAALKKDDTVTITIASPGVVTLTAHGYQDGDEVTLATTGALPSGLSVATKYYITNASTNTFELSSNPGGTSINTSGTQSGTHTLSHYPHGAGDGSSTFGLPDRVGRVRLGVGAGTISEGVDSNSVTNASDSFTVAPNEDKWVTGMKVQLTTTNTLPSGLSLATDYWIIRIDSTTIKFASSLANAQNGTVVSLSDDGTGIHTLTHNLKSRLIGKKGGEEDHAMSSTELLAHTHTLSRAGDTVGSPGGGPVVAGLANATTSSTGGNAAMNNAQPYGVDSIWIKT